MIFYNHTSAITHSGLMAHGFASQIHCIRVSSYSSLPLGLRIRHGLKGFLFFQNPRKSFFMWEFPDYIYFYIDIYHKKSRTALSGRHGSPFIKYFYLDTCNLGFGLRGRG
jgi:hypothetical protein